MAGKYVFVDKNGIPTANAGMGIQEFMGETDWTDDDIELIAQLKVGDTYRGDWPEQWSVKRVA